MTGPSRKRRPSSGGASAGRVVLLLAILLLVIVSVGLVVVSPLALRALDSGSQVDWNRLSNIGQTYGAVSAIIAAVALLGVMISLVIQSREARAVRKSARRAHHVELMRMAMDDPRYMECWGPYVTDTFAAEGQYTYINLIVAHRYSEYEVREMSEVLLRATAKYVFASAPGRVYWQNGGRFWRDNYSGRRARRFYRVLEETYQEAIKKPPSRPPREVAGTGAARAPPGLAGLGVGGGVGRGRCGGGDAAAAGALVVFGGWGAQVSFRGCAEVEQLVEVVLTDVEDVLVVGAEEQGRLVVTMVDLVPHGDVGRHLDPRRLVDTRQRVQAHAHDQDLPRLGFEETG